MIAEFISSLVTPASKWAKGMGYLHEAIAIEARARRCSDAWAEHQRQSKESILDALKGNQQHRTVLVVGSGACLDIPLGKLANLFERVILTDIVHPLKSKRHGWDNVTHVTLDITGQMETLFQNPETLPEIQVPEFYYDDPTIDCVLSVNLASQLPIMPLKYLSKNEMHHEHELVRFTKALLEAHFTWLSGFQCSTALICDKTWERLDLNGKLLESDDPLYGLLSQETSREWYWEVEPTHETGAEFSRRNRVGYWSNFLFTAPNDPSAKQNVNSNYPYVRY